MSRMKIYRFASFSFKYYDFLSTPVLMTVFEAETSIYLQQQVSKY